MAHFGRLSLPTNHDDVAYIQQHMKRYHGKIDGHTTLRNGKESETQKAWRHLSRRRQRRLLLGALKHRKEQNAPVTNTEDTTPAFNRIPTAHDRNNRASLKTTIVSAPDNAAMPSPDFTVNSLLPNADELAGGSIVPAANRAEVLAALKEGIGKNDFSFLATNNQMPDSPYTELSSKCLDDLNALAPPRNHHKFVFDGNKADVAVSKKGRRSQHLCGQGVRGILEQAGIPVSKNGIPPDAKAYNKALPKLGFSKIMDGTSGTTYSTAEVKEQMRQTLGTSNLPVVVVMENKGHGHIFFVNDDNKTYSDFRQGYGHGLKSPEQYHKWTAFALTDALVKNFGPKDQKALLAQKHTKAGRIQTASLNF